MAEIQQLINCLCFVQRPDTLRFRAVQGQPRHWSMREPTSGPTRSPRWRRYSGSWAASASCGGRAPRPTPTSWPHRCGLMWRESSPGSAAACWVRCALTPPQPGEHKSDHLCMEWGMTQNAPATVCCAGLTYSSHGSEKPFPSPLYVHLSSVVIVYVCWMLPL